MKEQTFKEIGVKGFFGQLRYCFYILFHPFAGFWDLKYEKRGSLKAATVLYAIFVFSVLFKRQLTAYLFNPYNTNYLEVLPEIFFALVPYFLWIVSSWCVTSLMDGEGSFGDIYKATGYALTPLTLANFLSVFLSMMITLDEASFYTLLTSLGTIWAFALIFFSLLVTQQFSLSKSLLAAIIIIVGMLVIVFLALLVFYLVQQVFGFCVDVYGELSLRFNE